MRKRIEPFWQASKKLFIQLLWRSSNFPFFPTFVFFQLSGERRRWRQGQHLGLEDDADVGTLEGARPDVHSGLVAPSRNVQTRNGLLGWNDQVLGLMLWCCGIGPKWNKRIISESNRSHYFRADARLIFQSPNTRSKPLSLSYAWLIIRTLL